MKPWDGVIPQHEQEAYRAAGFGRPSGPRAKRPWPGDHLTSQYRTSRHRAEAVHGGRIKEFPDRPAGRSAGNAVRHIARLLALFRQKGFGR